MAKRLPKKLVRALQVVSLSLALPILLTLGKSWAEAPAEAEVNQYIEKFRNSDDWRVYQDTIRDLQRIGPPAVPALREALKDPDSRVRVYAADALLGIGYEAKDAVPDLTEALKDKDNYVRASAGEALEAIGSRAYEALPALKAALQDEEANVRYIAAKALAKMGSKSKDAVPALTATLKDSDGHVRAAAAEAIGAIGREAKDAVPSLTEALRDRSPYVRSAAATALGAIGADAKPAISRLVTLLETKKDNKYVRSAAAEALGKIGTNPKTTVPVLIEALNDEKDRVRIKSAAALGKIGCQARSAIPGLIDSFNESEEERLSAVDGIAGIAGDCVEKADRLSDGQIAAIIADLEKAKAVLQDPKTQAPEEEIAQVNRHLKGLEAQKNARFTAIIGQTLGKNVFLTVLIVIIIYLIFMPILWGALLLIHPIMLLRINAAVEPFSEFALGGWMRGTKLSLRSLLLLTFFVYHKRALDAWVAEYINEARSELKQKETVLKHAFYLPAPAMVDGKTASPLSVSDLQAKFRQKQCYMLIWGEPGVGKSSIACQIAKWAMAENPEERLCEHLMLPVPIEEDLENIAPPPKTDKKEKKTEKPKSVLMEALRGQLQDIINEVKPIPEELVERLLQQQRLLVIVDRLSEMSETARAEIRPDSPNFPVNWLVVTSRVEEKLGGVVKNTIQPLRIDGSLTSSFLEDYLSETKTRSLFSDMEFIDACRDFSLRMGDRDVPAMVVRMYAELTIARQQGKVRGELSANIPAMMLQYLNRINDAVISGKLDNCTVQQDAKALAWECVKGSYRVAIVKRKDALAALGEKSDDRFKYLEERLRLAATIGISHDRARFTLEPLAEYLAGLQIVEANGDKEEAWREFLKKAKLLQKGAGVAKTFLLAVRDCCLSELIEVKVPDFAVSKLEQLTGLKPWEDEPEEAQAESAVTVSVTTPAPSEEGEAPQNVTTVTVSVPAQGTQHAATTEEPTEAAASLTTVTVAASSQHIASSEEPAEAAPAVSTVTVAVPATDAVEPAEPAPAVAVAVEPSETAETAQTAETAEVAPAVVAAESVPNGAAASEAVETPNGAAVEPGQPASTV